MELFLLPIVLLLGLGFLFFNDDDPATTDSDTAGDGGDGMTPDDQPVMPLGELLNFTDDDDTALGNDGDDVIRALGGDDIVLAGDGDDTVFAGDGNDTVMGEAGNDRVFLGRGNDVSSNADAFTDLAVVPEGQPAMGDDFIRGGAGADKIIDILGSNTLYGDTGDDILSGRDAEFDQGTPDTLFGGFGEDVLRGNDGDLLTGGADTDVFDIEVSGSASPAMITDFAAGENLIIRGADDAPVEMERLTTALADNGTDLNVILDDQVVAVLQGLTALPADAFAMMAGGTAGSAGSATDTPTYDNARFGTEGDDTIEASNGEDAVFSGAGDDVISLRTPAVSDPDDQDVRINAGIGDDIVVGGGGDDVIFGNLGVDLLAGNEGTDSLFGGFGNDLLVSDDPNTDSPDVADGGGGDDVLVADDGDVLTGGKGTDGFVNILRDVTHDPVVVTDFDPAKEALEIVIPPLNDAPSPAPTVAAALPVPTVVDTADGTATAVSLGDTVVFVLQGVKAADVNVAGIIVTEGANL